NVNLDLENTSLNNVQSNTHIEHYQRSRSPSVEPQSRETYNEIQQNQRNTQIHDSPNYNSIGSSAHSPFDANIYQHKAPLQMNRRSTNSFEDESSLPLQMSRRSIISSAQLI
ncbi:23793_t:CDS:2, partial [Gigaspora rosea]